MVAERFASAIFTRRDERYRDQLGDAGFIGPILQYIVANEASGPGGLRNAADPCGDYVSSGKGGAESLETFVTSSTHMKGCFSTTAPASDSIRRSPGRRKLASRRDATTWNLASVRWIEYFIGHASANAQQMGYTGLFIDNLDRWIERGMSRSENSDG